VAAKKEDKETGEEPQGDAKLSGAAYGLYYVWLEEKPAKRNFASVLKLMEEAEVTEKGKPSMPDTGMKFLEAASPLKDNHPAVKQYNKCMRGAGDTVRSIIISANSRLATLENKQVLRMLSRDELNLAELGIGVNEQSTHEYISKLLGKATIDKKSSGETRGRQGSSSRNYDVLGREIMTPDEVRKMDNKKCLIFIRGFDPIPDSKYNPFKHPVFAQTADGEGTPYEHEPAAEGESAEPGFTILNKKSLAYYEGMEPGLELEYAFDMEDETVDSSEENAGMSEFFVIGETGTAKPSVMGNDEKPETVPEGREKKLSAGREDKAADSISYRMFHWKFTVEQKEEVKRAMAVRVPKEVILSYFYPETSVVRMMEIRRRYE